jgi:eukaryotic translation initiation factor 2C
MDASLQAGCIVGAHLNEFYLTSHAALLGTSKPARYVLLYDEIGMTLGEIQLLTFWLTHLYCRSTRSVSIATPAYYAHHAAKRGRALLQAGKSASEVGEMSRAWVQQKPNSMYFI